MLRSAAAVIFFSASVAALSLGDFYQAAAKPITVEQAEKLLNFTQKMLVCYPPAVGELVKSLNKDQIGELVKLHNGIIDKSIDFPANRAEALALVKQHVPSVYDKLTAINEDYEKKLASLSPEAVALLKKVEADGFTAAENRTQAAYVDFTVNVCNEYESLPTAVHDNFKAAFPEGVACFDHSIEKKACDLAKQIKSDKYQLSSSVLQKFANVMSDSFFKQ